VRVHDDDDDFTQFVLESYAGLLRRAFLLVGDHGRAEDLVQTSLIAFYPRWRRVSDPAAYLRTVMIRTALGWRRRRWNAELPSDPVPDTAGRADRADDVALADVVRRALMALSADQRAVVVLRYFEDCSEADTARALGCSVGTVKSRASRALAALRASGVLAEEGVR
jgi:RNA polymerase sigma-70 factor (sigma-E family)